MNSKIIVIIGPTASGKSELATELAKKLCGEIISADSRQVYRGLDIGTAKVSGKWKRGVFTYKNIPHYCVDFVSPKKTYTAAEFKKLAGKIVEEILNRGKIPIIVGGTGFWIDALVYGFKLPEVRPDEKLRRHLSHKTAEELFRALERLDPNRAKTIERGNPRRLIRAIEIVKCLGKVPALEINPRFNAVWTGINPPSEILEKKIQKRADQMVKKGLVKEVKRMLDMRISRKRILELGFEYRLALECLDRKISSEELARRIGRETLKYAGRQMRWFRRNRQIKWFGNIREAKKFVSVKITGLRLRSRQKAQTSE